MADQPIRVVLNEAGFRDLVAGRIVHAVGQRQGETLSVELILSDIGWDRMQAALDDGRG